jgi:hypothetical protein
VEAYIENTLKIIKGTGVHAIVAGGYARDLHFGREPKDVDIVVSRHEMGDEEAHNLVEAACRAIDPNMVSHYQSHPDYPCDRIDYVFTLTNMKLPIDIIVYSGDYEDVGEIIDDFDCNLNMYALMHRTSGKKEVFYAGTSGKYKESVEGTLVFTHGREDVECKRRRKMFRIAKEVGWELPDECCHQLGDCHEPDVFELPDMFGEFL